ncbi:MAG: class I SAM-dependent methyltransferase [Cyclobacteriaceae bacterium]
MDETDSSAVEFNPPEDGNSAHAVSEDKTADEPVTISEADSIEFDLLVETYEDPERNKWQNPELVIKKIESPFDKTVADIGAGTGYFTFRLARWCKRVIALEIDPDFISYLEERKQDVPEPIANRITIRQTPETSAALSPGEADVALVVNTYYFLYNRVSYFSNIRQLLAEGGKVMIVDYKNADMPVESAYVRRIDWKEVMDELQQAGFNKVTVDTASLPYQYIVEGYKP